jgi:arginase family enzyme
MATDAPPPPPDNFLALEDPYATFETARVLILPVPLEATVSWGGGTARDAGVAERRALVGVTQVAVGVEQLLQLGVRSVDAEEVAYARAHEGRVRTWYAEDIHAGAWREEFVARVRGRRIHLTIDVDGLDPAIVPATGTPEPDGLSWREALEIISTTAAEGSILGIDCVELAPQPGLHHADFAVAKLLYKTITYAMNGA